MYLSIMAKSILLDQNAPGLKKSGLNSAHGGSDNFCFEDIALSRLGLGG